MARISSSHNPVVKYVRSLERTRVRREEGVYLAEGVRLIGEALATGQRAPIVLYDPDLLTRSAAGSSLVEAIPTWAEEAHEVDERVLAAAAQTEKSAGVVAVLRLPEFPPLATRATDRFGLILDRLADPGNAGTILRTADAAGVGFVCALPGTVDLFSPKVVRAGMGAHFRLELYQPITWNIVDRDLPDRSILLAEVEEGQSIFEIEWPERMALVIGSEATGVSPQAQLRTSGRVHIPMRAGVESLNASVAAAIIIYAALGRGIESKRQ